MKQFEDFTEFDYAYLAGFVDGDGTIYNGTDRDNCAVARVILTQKDIAYLEHWKRRFCCGYIRENETEFGICGSLSLSRVPSRYLCERMLPYLRMKRESAIKACGKDIKPNTSKKMFWPYLAGFTDAEGTMAIYDGRAKQKNGKIVDYEYTRFQLPQLDRQFLIYLRNTIGQGAVTKRGKTSTGNRMWQLVFGSKASRKLAEKIRPYLIIKAEAADMIINHEPKKRSDGTNSEDAQKAKELYQTGLSAKMVARKLGYKDATVNYWLREMDVTRSLEEAQQLRREREATANPKPESKPKAVALKDRSDVKRAIELYDQGLTQQMIADVINTEYNMSVEVSHISYWLRATGNNISRSEAHQRSRDAHAKVSENPKKCVRAKSLYGLGVSVQDIAQKLNETEAIIYYRLDFADKEIPEEEKFEDRPEVQEAAKLYKTGLSAREVAEQMDLNPSTVGDWMARLGIRRSRAESLKLVRERESA